MTFTRNDLDMAERHIAQGERHVLEQEAIVTKLEAGGSDTTLAKELLAEFNASLSQHRKDRDMIAAQLGRPT